MSGKPLILILLVLLTGCSTLKSGKTKTEHISSLSLGLEKIKAQNLSDNDFNIKKAEVEITIGDEKQKLLASVKYKTPGFWLVSLKSNTGIEVARAYMTADTLLINDRLQKKLFYGKTNAIEKKYGIPFIALPVMFGDFIVGNLSGMDSTICTEGRNTQTIKFEKFEIKYFINCRDSKIISSNIRDLENKEIQITYSKISLVDNKKYPARILVRDKTENCVIEIRIRNIDFNNIEKIDFIPGKGYENILLK